MTEMHEDLKSVLIAAGGLRGMPGDRFPEAVKQAEIEGLVEISPQGRVYTTDEGLALLATI